jgi:hypothetical protein
MSGGGGGDHVRSNLMEAIRAAGGADKASLRSAQERKYEAKKKKQEEKEKSSTAESGDMMADLKNTLAMRRKGISGIREGAKQNSVAGMAEIMQKLANTIPTMERSTESGTFIEEESSDEDWD